MSDRTIPTSQTTKVMASLGRLRSEHFVLTADHILVETDPDTFWQTPHYEGWPAVLIRFDSKDPERVREMIVRSRDWNAARPKPRPRKKK